MRNNKKNQWHESAKEYAEISPKISFYWETNKIMFDYFNALKINSIIDLGCGSNGIFLSLLLKLNPDIESVYAVDSSIDMLRECSTKIQSEKINFIHSDARFIDNKIKSKVDIVIVNSAFWLFDINRTLKSINNVLKKSGILLFNIGEWDYDIPGHIPHPVYDSIQIQLKEKNLELKRMRKQSEKLNKNEIIHLLYESGFSEIENKIRRTKANSEDWLNFYSIPTIIKKSLPNVPFNIAQNILKDAVLSLPNDRFPDLHWVYFKSIKN